MTNSEVPLWYVTFDRAETREGIMLLLARGFMYFSATHPADDDWTCGTVDNAYLLRWTDTAPEQVRIGLYLSDRPEFPRRRCFTVEVDIGIGMGSRDVGLAQLREMLSELHWNEG